MQRKRRGEREKEKGREREREVALLLPSDTKILCGRMNQAMYPCLLMEEEKGS